MTDLQEYMSRYALNQYECMTEYGIFKLETHSRENSSRQILSRMRMSLAVHGTNGRLRRART